VCLLQYCKNQYLFKAAVTVDALPGKPFNGTTLRDNRRKAHETTLQAASLIWASHNFVIGKDDDTFFGKSFSGDISRAIRQRKLGMSNL